MPRKKKQPIATKEGLVDRLERVIEDTETKVGDKLRAIKQLSDMRGYTMDKTFKSLERMSPEDLEKRIKEIVIPAIKPYLKRFADLELNGTIEDFAAYLEHGGSGEKPSEPGAGSAAMRGDPKA